MVFMGRKRGLEYLDADLDARGSPLAEERPVTKIWDDSHRAPHSWLSRSGIYVRMTQHLLESHIFNL